MISIKRSPQNITITLLLLLVTIGPNFLLYDWGDADENIKATTHVFTLLGVLVVLWYMPFTRKLLSQLGKLAALTKRIPDIWLICGLSLTVFITTCTLSGVLFDHLPHVADSQAQYIQSKIFASGKFYEPGHPLHETFSAKFMTGKARYYSYYPPGHALLLAAGQLLGVPWMVNPMAAALLIFAVYYLGCEVGTRTTGRLAAMLALLSPFFIFMSSEFMNHPPALLAVTLMLLFYIRLLKNPCLSNAFFLGLSISVIGLTRPQILMQYGLFLIPHALYVLIRDRVYILLFLFTIVVGTPAALFFMYYNYQTNGDPFTSGYQEMFATTHASVGTWVAAALGYADYGVIKHFVRAAKQAGGFNQQLFSWPIASVAFALLLFMFKMERKYTYILAGTYLALCLGLTLANPGWVHLFGPRYTFEVCGIFMVMTAMMMERFPAFLRKIHIPYVTSSLYRGSLLLSVITLTTIGYFTETKGLYDMYRNHYWEGNSGYYKMVTKAVQTPAIVLNDYNQFFYVSFTLPPDDNAPIIFTRWQLLPKIREYYPDRYIYSVENSKGKIQMGPIWVRQLFAPVKDAKDMESDAMVFEMLKTYNRF